MKKHLYFIILSAILILFTLQLFCFCSSTPEFNKVKDEREKIVEQVISGEIPVLDNGLIELPDDKKYLSDTGYCCLVEYWIDEYAIYFFSVRGMLGDSKGYLYNLDLNDQNLIDKASARFTFRDIEFIDNNWYSCKTSD